VLDHDRGRLGELEREAERRIEIENVIVRQLLAAEHLGRGDRRAPRCCRWQRRARIGVERGALVGVLAVAQLVEPPPRYAERVGQLAARRDGLARGRRGVVDRRQIRRDRGIVRRGVGECGARQREPLRRRQPAAAQRLADPAVVRRIDHDGDALVVLGGRAQHRRAADVDVLDRLVERGLGSRDRRLERIQVDDEQIDRRDRMRRHLALVRGGVATEQPAVDPRVQRLDPAIEDLGRAGVGRDLGHRDPGGAQRGRRPAGRQDLEPGLVDHLRQLDHAPLVAHGNQRAPHHAARIPT
jgi:hypothetical protein